MFDFSFLTISYTETAPCIYLLMGHPHSHFGRGGRSTTGRRDDGTTGLRDIRDTLKEGLDDISVDLAEVEKVVAPMPESKRAFVWSLLVDIIRKDYGDLKHNKKDNRVWTPYAQLPAEVRAVIKVGGLSYQQTIDIRSCYPSLWVEYVMSVSHTSMDLECERVRWNALFLNKDTDPKTHIAKAVGVSRDKVKEIMIQYFNGKIKGEAFKAFDVWISREFPALYAAWKETDIRQTGNNIGKYFGFAKQNRG